MNESGNDPSISAKTVPWGARVYFIDDGELIKIGFSHATHQRFGSLQTNHGKKLRLLGTIRAEGYKTERELHQRFAHLRERGEWFRKDPELLDFITANATPPATLSTWETLAEQFIARRRRDKTGDSRAIHAGTRVGFLMHMLANRETPELKAEFVQALARFEALRACT